MKAFLLAAGFGKRLQPLTLATPKPLIRVGAKSLIERHIEAIRDAGINDFVINTHWLGEKIQAAIGDGRRYGIRVHWAHEPVILETGGGIYAARHSIGDDDLLVVSADIYTDFDYSSFAGQSLAEDVGRLLLVNNPQHHPAGDFSLRRGRVQMSDTPQTNYTYSGISLLSSAWIRSWLPQQPAFPLADRFKDAIGENRLAGVIHSGFWTDVGTAQRLQTLQQIHAVE